MIASGGQDVVEEADSVGKHRHRGEDDGQAGHDLGEPGNDGDGQESSICAPRSLVCAQMEDDERPKSLGPILVRILRRLILIKIGHSFLQCLHCTILGLKRTNL